MKAGDTAIFPKANTLKFKKYEGTKVTISAITDTHATAIFYDGLKYSLFKHRFIVCKTQNHPLTKIFQNEK